MKCGTTAASRPKRAATVPRSLLCRVPDGHQAVHPSPDCVIRSSFKSLPSTFCGISSFISCSANNYGLHYSGDLRCSHKKIEIDLPSLPAWDDQITLK